jgi:acetyl-CoA acetyltransferase
MRRRHHEHGPGSRARPAGPDPSLLLQSANAIRGALRRGGTIGVSDLDLIEINEAFAGVPLASMRDLGLSPDRVNINGSASALGHPVGMSGVRLALTLALELRRYGGGIGAAALCGAARATRSSCVYLAIRSCPPSLPGKRARDQEPDRQVMIWAAPSR